MLQAIEEITLHSRDLLHKLLPCQQAGDVDTDIYDQLEVSTYHRTGSADLTQSCGGTINNKLTRHISIVKN